MKTFDEKEINRLLKTQKITIDEFVKTRDKELTIDEKTLEAEKRTAAALEAISRLLTDIVKNHTGNTEDEKHTKLLNCMAGILTEIKEQKKPVKWEATFARDSIGRIDGKITFKAKEG